MEKNPEAIAPPVNTDIKDKKSDKPEKPEKYPNKDSKEGDAYMLEAKKALERIIFHHTIRKNSWFLC